MPTQHFNVKITAGKRTPARVSVHWLGKPRDLTMVNGETLAASQACEFVRSELQEALNELERDSDELGAGDVWPMVHGTKRIRRKREATRNA